MAFDMFRRENKKEREHEHYHFTQSDMDNLLKRIDELNDRLKRNTIEIDNMRLRKNAEIMDLNESFNSKLESINDSMKGIYEMLSKIDELEKRISLLESKPSSKKSMKKEKPLTQVDIALITIIKENPGKTIRELINLSQERKISSKRTAQNKLKKFMKNKEKYITLLNPQ